MNEPKRSMRMVPKGDHAVNCSSDKVPRETGFWLSTQAFRLSSCMLLVLYMWPGFSEKEIFKNKVKKKKKKGVF